MQDPDWGDWGQKLRSGGSVVAEAWKGMLEARISRRGGHPQAAALCESSAMGHLALREWQLALRDTPADIVIMLRLANIHQERGEHDKSLRLLEEVLSIEPSNLEGLRRAAGLLREEDNLQRLRQLLARGVAAGLPEAEARRLLPTAAAPSVAREATGALVFTDADCMRFHALFAGREDTYARQWAGEAGSTGYTPVHEPFTPAVARNHFNGTCTVGLYPIRLDGTCTFCALDLDITKAALERASRGQQLAQDLRTRLRSTASLVLERIRALGLQPLFEHSGYKGRHYWIFLERPELAGNLHQLGRMLLDWLAPVLEADFHLEFFPKQGTVKGKGLGNLIKLPLGIHRRTGHRANLLDDSGEPVPEPLQRLREVHKHSRETIIRVMDKLKLAVPRARVVEPPPADIEAVTPAPPLPPRMEICWTEADFETDRPVAHVMGNCQVLAELRVRADNQRTLSHDEQLILIHTLGHLESGPAAVNHLLGKCLDVGHEKYMKDRHKGSPTSCPSIRKRIPLITRGVVCNCDFSFAPDRYPTPVLHLLTLPAAPAAPAPGPGRSLAELAVSLLILSRRAHEILEEEKQLRAALTLGLRTEPSRSVTVETGSFSLVEKDGIEELVWAPTPAPDKGV